MPQAFPDPILFSRRTLTRRFLMMGLAFLVAALVLGTLSLMIQREVARMKEARAERTWTVKTLNAIAELAVKKDEAENLKMQLTFRLPVALEVPTEVIPHFQNLASRAGISLTFKIERLRPATAEEPLGIGFSLRTRGTAQNTVRFLRDIEMDKFIRAESWELTPTGSPAEYDFTLAGVMYLESE